LMPCKSREIVLVLEFAASKGWHTYDILTTIIEALHNEYKVVENLRGLTTDNCSNFLKAPGGTVMSYRYSFYIAFIYSFSKVFLFHLWHQIILSVWYKKQMFIGC
jgi:hypothetical protein